MVVIKVNERLASWDSGIFRWHSDFKPFADVLNDTIPWEEAGTVDAPLRTGGVDAIVLRAARKVIPELEVVLKTPPVYPPEVDGQDV